MMTESRGTIRRVVWEDACPWLILFKTFRLAITFRVLILAVLGVLGVSAGWRLLGDLFYGAEDPVLRRRIEEQTPWPWQIANTPTAWMLNVAPRPLAERDPRTLRGEAGGLEISLPDSSSRPLIWVWSAVMRPLVELSRGHLTVERLAFAILSAAWVFFVWAILGGAISRIAALALTRGEPLGLAAGLRHGRSFCGDYLLATALPLIAALLAILGYAGLGLLMRLEIGVLLAALLWPIGLLLALFIAIVLVGFLLGWPLMWPTVAVEEDGGFDAISRAYAYVFQRPLHYLFYIIVASLIGLAGVFAVGLFVDLVIGFPEWAATWGSGSDRMTEIAAVGAGGQATESGLMLRAGATLLGVWTDLVRTVEQAFQFGFFWVAATAVYLLLRRDVDATDMDEIHLDEEEEAYQLPGLEKDQAGVPGVSEGDDSTDEK